MENLARIKFVTHLTYCSISHVLKFQQIKSIIHCLFCSSDSFPPMNSTPGPALHDEVKIILYWDLV